MGAVKKEEDPAQLDGGSGDESDSSNHEEVVQMLLQPGAAGPPIDIGTVVPSPAECRS